MCLAQGPQRSDTGEARTRGPSASSQASATEPLRSKVLFCQLSLMGLYILMTFFQGQTILGNSNAVLPELPETSYLTSLSSIAFDPQEVEEILKILKTDKASGPNGLSNNILKTLSHELSSLLCSLFNKSLSLGNFPSSYKDAKVTPVHKTCLLLPIIGLSLLNSSA